jgi:hypothetical protein
LIVVAGAFIGGVPAFAHHSFAATYFEDKSVTIEGNVVEFDFRNPHSLLTLEVADDGAWPGKSGDVACGMAQRRAVVERWRVEGDASSRGSCDCLPAALAMLRLSIRFILRRLTVPPMDFIGSRVRGSVAPAGRPAAGPKPRPTWYKSGGACKKIQVNWH